MATLTTLPRWSVSDRLRKARECAGLEQRQLAAVAGISRATISNAERGVGNPNLATLRRWADATRVPVAWLLGELDELEQLDELAELAQLDDAGGARVA